MLPEPIGAAALKARWLASPWVRAFELGQIGPDAFADGLVRDWKLSCSPADFIADFTGWPRGFHDGALELVADLRTRHRVGFLTNSNALHWARFGGFAGLFDVALSSHLTGFIKPDAACFRHAVAACGVPASRVRYFDDAMPNVLGARACGIEAWHVDGLQETRDVLARL